MKKEHAAKKHHPTGLMAEEYTYSVMWSEEDDAFIGRVVEFPSLAAHGNTLEGALKEITSAVGAVLEDLKDNDEPVPEPLTKKKFSGKLNLRLPSHLHRQLTIEAKREGTTLNQWINMKLASKVV